MSKDTGSKSAGKGNSAEAGAKESSEGARKGTQDARPANDKSGQSSGKPTNVGSSQGGALPGAGTAPKR